MPCSAGMREKANKVLDSIATRLDSIAQSRVDAFEEAHHPRNAGGVFTAGEGEESKEDNDDDDKNDTQEEPGNLGKRNAS